MARKQPFASEESVRLGEQLARMEERIAALEAGQNTPQLTYASIENGAIKAYDAKGQLKQQIGRQTDGSFGVVYANGAPPPTPDDPLVTAGQLSLIVYWNGQFRGGVAKPKDFQRVDVHIARDEEFFEPNATTTLYSSLFGEGAVTVPLDTGTYYVKLVAVTHADTPSVPTYGIQGDPAAAKQIAAGAIGADQLAADLILGSRIIAGNPVGGRVELTKEGIKGYNAQNKNTLDQDVTTGNMYFKGILATGEVGQRIVINDPDTKDGYRTITFYGVDGKKTASMRQYTTPDEVSAGLHLESSAYDTDDRISSLDLAPDQLGVQTREASTKRPIVTQKFTRNGAQFGSPETTFAINEGYDGAMPSGEPAIHVQSYIWDGSKFDPDPKAKLSFKRGQVGDNWMMMSWKGADAGLIAHDGTIFAVDESDSGGQFRDFRGYQLFAEDSLDSPNVNTSYIDTVEVNATGNIKTSEIVRGDNSVEGGHLHSDLDIYASRDVTADNRLQGYNVDAQNNMTTGYMRSYGSIDADNNMEAGYINSRGSVDGDYLYSRGSIEADNNMYCIELHTSGNIYCPDIVYANSSMEAGHVHSDLDMYASRNITADNDVYCVTLHESSDEELKTDIAGLPFSGLHTVLSIDPKSWQWHNDRSARPNYGFIANELPEEFRTTHPDSGRYYVDVMKMIATAWQAVQELAERQNIQLDRSQLPDSVRDILGGAS